MSLDLDRTPCFLCSSFLFSFKVLPMFPRSVDGVRTLSISILSPKWKSKSRSLVIFLLFLSLCTRVSSLFLLNRPYSSPFLFFFISPSPSLSISFLSSQIQLGLSPVAATAAMLLLYLLSPNIWIISH